MRVPSTGKECCGLQKPVNHQPSESDGTLSSLTSSLARSCDSRRPRVFHNPTARRRLCLSGVKLLRLWRRGGVITGAQRTGTA